MSEGVRPRECDTLKLMRQLARMANMEHAHIRRMVLVLDPERLPLLYVDTLLSASEESLGEGAAAGARLQARPGAAPADAEVEAEFRLPASSLKDRPGALEATSVQNQHYRTFAPRPGREFL